MAQFLLVRSYLKVSLKEMRNRANSALLQLAIDVAFISQ